jgi:hypothetical protein
VPFQLEHVFRYRGRSINVDRTTEETALTIMHKKRISIAKRGCVQSHKSDRNKKLLAAGPNALKSRAVTLEKKKDYRIIIVLLFCQNV